MAARGTREHQAGHLCFTAPRHGSQQPPRCCLTHFCLLARSSVGGTRGSPGAVHELPKLPKPCCGCAGVRPSPPCCPWPPDLWDKLTSFAGAVAQGSVCCQKQLGKESLGSSMPGTVVSVSRQKG